MATTLDEYLEILGPQYRWRFDETGTDPFLDSGLAAVDIDLAPQGTQPTRSLSGPDASTTGIDWGTSSSNLANKGGLAVLGGTSGSVVCAYNVESSIGNIMSLFGVDSNNETDQILFGSGGRGLAGSGRQDKLSITIVDVGFTQYRMIHTTDDVVTNDGDWHIAVYSFSGSADGYSIAIDGVDKATTTVTATPPGNTTWFETNITPDRTYVANGRAVSGTENYSNLSSIICVYTTPLTAQEITNITLAQAGTLVLGGGGANRAITMRANRNTRGFQ